MSENYIDKIILSSVDAMKKTKYSWPASWNLDLKMNFLNQCLEWLEKNEYYEHCKIIMYEKKKLQKK